MSIEENKEIAHRFIHVWGTGGLTIVDELAAPDIAVSYPAFSIRGAEGYKQVLTRFCASFADNEIAVDDLIAEGDKVAVRWTYRGTHQGEFRGIPPTGKQVTLTGITIYRTAGGKVVEERGAEDLLGLLQQLGALPSRGNASQ